METREAALLRGVHDTLDSIVSPAVRDTLLGEALSRAGLTAIPTDPDPFLAFLDGPLRLTLEQALGRELGRSVREELERLSVLLAQAEADPMEQLEAARARASRSPAMLERDPSPDRRPTRSDVPVQSSETRRTLPSGGTPQRETLTPEMERMSRAPTITTQPAVRWSEPRPPASGDYPSGTADALGMKAPDSQLPASRRLPMVFIATRDAELVRRFGAWLDPHAVVVRVSRLIDLLLDIEDVGKRKTVIVFDCRRPPWRPEALSAVADELPEETQVLLWGTPRDLQAQLTKISPRVTRWIACPDGMPLADVVDQCVRLVG